MSMPLFTPPASIEIDLADLLGALSHALDLTEGQPAGHAIRCCWIGLNVGETLGLPPAELCELYYVLLLKDLGCSSNAARICQLYLADDIVFKHDFKQIDGSLPQALRFVLAHTGLQSGLAERFRAILKIFQEGGQIARELIETRCQRGADIARKLRFSEAVAIGIRDLDEHWDGGGQPCGLAGDSIPIQAQIALLSQVVDVFSRTGDAASARAEVRNRAGGWFSPAVVDAFLRCSTDEAFWATLGAADIPEHMHRRVPPGAAIAIDDDYLDDIAAAFADVIDAKSPWTSGHSRRVTLFADMIAAEMSMAEDRRRWLKRIALMHDIGKLGVSNAILDKPGRPDETEWAAIKLHAIHTEAILARIRSFEDLAFVAGAHHERLDGKGYPRGVSADRLPLETRIVSCADVFDALTAERPYRAAMPVSKALSIMEADRGTAFDPDCLDALARAMSDLSPAVAEAA